MSTGARWVPPLHLVTDDRILGSPDFTARAKEAVEEGGERVALHLRGPRASGRRLWDLGSDLLPVARAHGTSLIVNDRVDLALALGASGAHLGERSLPPGVVRRLLGPSFLLGRSVHGPPPDHPVDYFHVGTLYPTPSHAGREGTGEPGFRALAATLPGIPVLAIGGVTLERIPALMAAGAHGVAVARAAWDTASPGGSVRALLECLDASGAAPPRIRLQVNGKERLARPGITVRDLLEGLSLVPALVVVERNREILDRAFYEKTRVEDGDRLELVHFVGGG